MNPIEQMDVRERTLHKILVAAQEPFSPSLANSMGIELLSDILKDRLVMQLRTYVLADKLADAERTFHFRWEASAWQRFKMRHLKTFLRWRLVPRVKYMTAKATVEVRSWATYPEASLVTPELGAPVRFQEMFMRQSEPLPEWKPAGTSGSREPTRGR